MRQYEALKRDLAKRSMFDRVAHQTFRREALILDTDRDPADVVLRRTAALQALFLIGGAALLANLIHVAALFPLGQKLFDGELPLSLWLLLPWGVAGLLVLTARLAPPLRPAARGGKA